MAATGAAAVMVATAGCGVQPRTRDDARPLPPRDAEQPDDAQPDAAQPGAAQPDRAGVGDPAPAGPTTTVSDTAAAGDPTATGDAVAGADPARAADALHRSLRAALADPTNRAATIDRVIAPGTELLALARVDLAAVPTLDAPAIDLAVHAVRDTGTDLLASDGARRWVVTVQRWDGRWRLAAILPLLDGPPMVVLDADPNGARA